MIGLELINPRTEGEGTLRWFKPRLKPRVLTLAVSLFFFSCRNLSCQSGSLLQLQRQNEGRLINFHFPPVNTAAVNEIVKEIGKLKLTIRDLEEPHANMKQKIDAIESKRKELGQQYVRMTPILSFCSPPLKSRIREVNADL